MYLRRCSREIVLESEDFLLEVSLLDNPVLVHDSEVKIICLTERKKIKKSNVIMHKLSG